MLIAPGVKENAHWEGEHVAPFVVGDVDPSGAFVHVLDEATLDIVLGELDTITDFTAYLSKKENLIRSGRLISAAGEEELAAYYMTHMNSVGEHDFTKPDGTSSARTTTFPLMWDSTAACSKTNNIKQKSCR